ncbi:carbohydrate porin [Desulfothermus okinawensis JCM 13304]
MVSKKILFMALVFLVSTTFKSYVHAYDITKELSLDVSISGAYQYMDYDSNNTDDSLGRGSVSSDIGFNFHPTDIDELQLTFSFAAGNSLHNNSPFMFSSYAEDLEDDVKDINGRSRDYLLEAWYKHTFNISQDISLSGTFGIIDSTAYLDANEFANDQATQFMNEVFVNNPLLNLPSYDIGGVVELSIKNFYIKALGMSTKTDKWETPDEDDTKSYNYYGAEIGYNLNTPLGQGNYRLTGYETTEEFQGWKGSEERYQGIGVSIDQKLGDIFGVFFRFGWQDDDAIVDFDTMYSGGININGKLWGREDDEIGVGYAYLDGADKADVDNTQAVEGYIKFKVTDYSHLSLDIQYMDDNYKHNIDDTDGFIYGVRYVVEF